MPDFEPDPGLRRYEKHIPNCGLGVSTLVELDDLVIVNMKDKEESVRIYLRSPLKVAAALSHLKMRGTEEFLDIGFNLDYVHAEIGEDWIEKYGNFQ